MQSKFEHLEIAHQDLTIQVPQVKQPYILEYVTPYLGIHKGGYEARVDHVNGGISRASGETPDVAISNALASASAIYPDHNGHNAEEY